MALVLLSASFQSLPPLPTIKLGPSSAASRVGGCVCSRPLWVSPANSPVRLQVSPAATPTPTGVFNQRFEALFPPHWSPGLCGLLCSLPFVRFICANVGPQGLLVLGLPAPLVPHSASLGPPQPRESSPPRCPSPPLLPVWMNVYVVFPWCWTPLPLDFSVSSGCARRRSVSTYAAILVL